MQSVNMCRLKPSLQREPESQPIRLIRPIHPIRRVSRIRQQDPSGDTGIPQTGDSSNMMLWISLMLASCGGVLGMLFYRRKKAAAGK